MKFAYALLQLMNKMFVIFAISLSLLIVVGDTMLMSCALAEATDSNASSIISSGGLSANSVHNSNVIAHIIGNLSNMTSSGGLSANSVHNSNVIAHIIGNTAHP